MSTHLATCAATSNLAGPAALAAEGFALDWSPAVAGRLASGDCRSRIHVWDPTPAGKWTVSAPYK